ncbi:MAG: LysM peptidoglycan-binding domain-containing protein [Anaerolineae bacterium]|nr:LysM peptidoglycan-binding domain-containing protein [Anaerolineae bacterium]
MIHESNQIGSRPKLFQALHTLYTRHIDKALWVVAAIALILLLIGILSMAKISIPRLFSSATGGIFSQSSVSAKSWGVNSFDDAADATPGDGICETSTGSGVCTLRAALQEANMSAEESVINLQAGTYHITLSGVSEDQGASGDLDINASISLIGAGAQDTIIQGDGLEDVFDINGTAGSPVSVSMNALKIRNGVKGIYAQYAQLQLEDVIVEDNSSSGIDVQATDLTVVRSLIQKNLSGGINAQGDAQGNALTVQDSQIIANQANGIAVGGIRAMQVNATLINTTISDNRSDITAGVASDSTLTIIGCTISNNQGGMGGIYNTGKTAIVNSTISGNTGVQMGGIFFGGNANVYNSTITNNKSTTTDAGGEIAGGIFSGGGVVYLANTILQGNLSASVSPDCAGVIHSDGYNLIGSVSGCTFESSSGDLIGVKALLAPLADNGGQTLTHALQQGSPAINGGNPLGCVDHLGAALLIDQRGAERPQDGRCDIGAYEASVDVSSSNPPPSPPSSSLPNLGGTTSSQPPAPSLAHDETEEDWQPPPYPESWIVQYGEFPACLAARFNIDLNYFLSYNKLSVDSIIHPGQELFFPTEEHPYKGKRTWMKHPSEYKVAAGEDLFIIACKFGDVRPEDIAEANGFPNPLMETVRFTKGEQVIQIP